MNETEKFLFVMGVVTLRRSSLYDFINRKGNVDSVKLKGIIEEMKSSEFISPQEKQTNQIDVNLSLDKLGIDIEPIIKDVHRDAMQI